VKRTWEDYERIGVALSRVRRELDELNHDEFRLDLNHDEVRAPFGNHPGARKMWEAAELLERATADFDGQYFADGLNIKSDGEYGETSPMYPLDDETNLDEIPDAEFVIELNRRLVKHLPGIKRMSGTIETPEGA
jgi:hypothetical protein